MQCPSPVGFRPFVGGDFVSAKSGRHAIAGHYAARVGTSLVVIAKHPDGTTDWAEHIADCGHGERLDMGQDDRVVVIGGCTGGTLVGAYD